MTAPLITKAEILLTRRCNIACSTCAVINPAKGAVREMSAEDWGRAFDVIYGKLGAGFVALYGGEPRVMGDDFLCAIFRHLSKWRTSQRDFTVISNAIGLTEASADRYIDAGMQSWTSSVDTFNAQSIGDRYMQAKSQTGVKALSLFKKKGLRDTCGIVTVTARNLDQVLPTVEFLCGEGHWVGIDLLHYQRGDGEYTFSTTREQMEPFGLLLTREHLPRLKAIAESLLARHGDLLVFPTKRVLQMWADPKVSIDLTWKCQPGHAITLDPDGSLGLCDDRMPTGYGPERQALAQEYAPDGSLGQVWSIFDFDSEEPELSETWAKFLEWYGKDLEKCAGCFWSTHVMAVDALRDDKLRGHYVHQVRPGELADA